VRPGAVDEGTRGQSRLGLLAPPAVLGILFVGATLPTPLYPLYSETFGFGQITLTLIYAVYVLGNLIALFLFGRLSDQVGRRTVTVLVIGLGILSTLLFLIADHISWLFAARIVSGLATGLGAGTLTAWIAELQPRGDRAAAAMLASAANLAGLAVAPLLAGALAQVAPAPLRLPYLVYLVLLAAAGAAAMRIPETVEQPVRRWADLELRPRLGVPQKIRMAFLAPAITAFATFALIGFYAALIPSLLRDSLGQSSPLIAGLVVFGLFAVATAVTALTTRLAERTAMLSGLALLPPALALLVAAQSLRSMLFLLAATATAGVASALGYRGSLEVVNRIAPDERRSEVVSSYLIAVYLGNSLPVIGIGVVSEWAGAVAADRVFAGVIAVLAAGALISGSEMIDRLPTDAGASRCTSGRECAKPAPTVDPGLTR
jgi:MFS family permease